MARKGGLPRLFRKIGEQASDNPAPSSKKADSKNIKASEKGKRRLEISGLEAAIFGERPDAPGSQVWGSGHSRA